MRDELDEYDREILRLLQKNANLTTKELAAEVHLSASPVHERKQRLERLGYIQKYVAVVDPKMVGNGFVVLCNVRLKQQNKECGQNFVGAIADAEEIVECYNTSGSYDYIIKIYVRSMEHYQKFVLDTLGTIESVGSLHSIFVIGEEKNTHSVPV